MPKILKAIFSRKLIEIDIFKEITEVQFYFYFIFRVGLGLLLSWSLVCFIEWSLTFKDLRIFLILLIVTGISYFFCSTPSGDKDV